MSTATSLDPKAFRQALGSFTTGVTIVTTRTAAGEPVGLTANSFNSVSLDPPLVLWSLAKTSRNMAHFEAAEHWAVHILSADQEALSNRFARSGEDKFAGVQTESGVGGVPLLPGCATRLQCKTRFQYQGGDHIIFVGEVLDFDRADCKPLVFHGGGYALAMRKPAAAAASPAPAPDGMAAGVGDDMLDFLLPRAHYQIYARMREVHEAAGLNDAQLFVLVSLVTGGHRAIGDIQRMFGLTGHRIQPEHLETLRARGLIGQGADEQDLRITEAGRELALRMLAAGKDIESDILDKFEPWDAVLLKTLLKQLVQITAIGLPPMWSQAAEEDKP